MIAMFRKVMSLRWRPGLTFAARVDVKAFQAAAKPTRPAPRNCPDLAAHLRSKPFARFSAIRIPQATEPVAASRIAGIRDAHTWRLRSGWHRNYRENRARHPLLTTMIPHKTTKLAIVCAGGGTSCSYSGGALTALAKEQGLLLPDYMIAASGSAGSAVYYLTGQYDSIRRTWTKHICSPRFLSFRRIRRIMDVDYLVDTIIGKMEPLDFEKLASVRTRFFIAVKNAATGKGRYVSCREELNLHDVLRATKALPIFYGKKVNIGGELFSDSAFVITKEHGVAKAIELGATHVLVLEINSRKETRLQPLAKKIASRLMGGNTDHDPRPHGVEIFRVGPDKNPALPFTRNPKLLAAAFDKGYDDVRNSSELRAFLEPFVQA
jgi:predicted patatin/cPLA2 family phospholipase